MGRIAQILSFTRTVINGARVSKVKINPGGKLNITSEHFSDPGDDSFPLITDFAITTDIPRSGGEAVTGYLDPINTPKALEGEKRIYARDLSDGSVVVEIWLKNDGEALISNSSGSFVLKPDGSMKGSNSSGSFELEAGGDFLVNGVTIDTNGNINSPTSISAPSIVVDTKELKDHDHPITSGSSAPGPTGPNN